MPIRNMNFSILGVKNRKSVLFEPLWCVECLPSILNLLISGSTRFVNSTSLTVSLFPGMNGSFVSMQTIISREQADKK